MGKQLIIIMIACFALSCNDDKSAGDYVVNKVTPSCSCTVQLKTASPIGAKHLGPFRTKEEARKAMCADIDPTMTNRDHCWVTTPKDACD